MKDSPRQQFRWAPHVSGSALPKPKDYEASGQVEAIHEYDAWRQLRETGAGLEVGDLLETEDLRLSICKYVGFEPAAWVVPDPKTAPDAKGAGVPALSEPEPAGQSAGN